MHFATIFMRGQIVHKGHIHLIRKAIESENSKTRHPAQILILVGSYNQRTSTKNPFSFQEVKTMLEGSLADAELDVFADIKILPLNDYRYMDSQWMLDVQQTVKHYLQHNPYHVVYEHNTIYGHNKDNSSSYLKWFPEWKFVEVGNYDGLNATDVRQTWLNCRQTPTASMSRHVYPSVMQYLDDRQFDQDLADDEFYYAVKEPKMFESYPYKETLGFACGDMVLECAGHIALVKRKFAPGKNCWALPGGFKNRGETFVDCAVRELYEELDPKIAERVVRKSIVNTHLFDDPTRSFGISRHTLAVHAKIDLDYDGTLPKLRPADDAVEAKWVSIEAALNEYKLYDDHGDIIMFMTGVVPKPAYLLH